MTTELAKPKYRADIDGLRAISVLAVLGFHAFPTSIMGGFIGVDVFFVISGFLISTLIFENLDKGTFSFSAFYTRRIKRIFPALLLVLIASYVLGWFALFADEYKQLGRHITGAAGFASNFVLWSEAGYFDNSAETKPLLHLWSLGIEEQFYLLWPLVLWFVRNRKSNLLSLTVIVALVSFSLNLKGIRHDSVATFYSPQTRFWELLCGGILAGIIPYKKKTLAKLNLSIESLFFRRLSDLLSALGLMLLLYGFWRFSRSMDFPGEWAVLPVLGAVLIILTGPEGWINRTILSNKIIVWIGLISFPLYLWHWPLLSFARIVESEEPSCNIRTMVVILSFALAWLTYKFIERPIQLSVRNKTLVTVLVLCMAVVGFAGIYAYNCDGLKFRSAEKATTINRFDLPYRESCEKITGETYGDDWCNAGTTTKEPISSVIIGDSFSNSYTPMLKAYFEKVDQNFSFIQFARGQCPSLINYGPTYCQIITAKSFEYIKNSPAVKKVVLAAHWPAYYSGKRNFFQSNHIESAASFKEAFERTIKSYRDLGKEVIVLLATPVGGLPKSCVIRPLRITDRNICNLSIQNALNTDGDYRDYMIPFLDSLNIRYFDPFKYFCNDTECKLTMDGEIFNVDTYHLSVFGGEFLLNRGSGELRNLLSN